LQQTRYFLDLADLDRFRVAEDGDV
jgi:hypothetical protein